MIRWPLALFALLLVMPAAVRAQAPACFGAAARDPAKPQCRAAAHSPSVRPTPAEAPALPNSPCRALVLDDGPPVCEFGADPAEATRTVALVGDSHAGHWRAALQMVAAAKGWQGLSVTHTSCPLQRAVR